MKIIIITGPFQSLPPETTGAVEKIWIDLAGEFARSGHDVTFISRGYSDIASLNKRNPDLGYEFIRGYSAGRSLAVNLLKDLLYTLDTHRHLSADVDVVVTNTFWAPALLSLKRDRKFKVVVSVARMPKGQLFLYRNTDRLIAVSGAARDEVLRQVPSMSAKVEIIPNPIDTAVFQPDPEIPRIAGRITYAGRVCPEKGVHLLISAFKTVAAIHPEASLRIIGPFRAGDGGDETYADDLRQKSAGCNIEFLGPVYDKAVLADHLRRTQIFCYPSVAEKGETFGVAPLEAMACGALTICSDLACFREFLKPGENGFVFNHREHPEENLSKVLGDCFSKGHASIAARGAVTAMGYGSSRIAGLYLNSFHSMIGSSR